MTELKDSIRNLNKRKLTKVQLENLRKQELDIESTIESQRRCTDILADRYLKARLVNFKRLLPNEIKGRGENSETVAMLKRCIANMERYFNGTE